MVDEIDKIQELNENIKSIHYSALEEVFSKNNKAVEKYKEMGEKEDKIRRHVARILYSLIGKDRLCIDNEITIREGNIYRYKSWNTATLTSIFKNLDFDVLDKYIEEKEILDDLKDLIIKFKHYFNLRKSSDFKSITKRNSIPEIAEISDSTDDDYYLCYNPSKSSHNNIFIRGSHKSSQLQFLENLNRVVSTMPHIRISEYSTSNNMNMTLSEVAHSEVSSKLIDESVKKINLILEYYSEIINDIEEKFAIRLAVMEI